MPITIDSNALMKGFSGTKYVSSSIHIPRHIKMTPDATKRVDKNVCFLLKMLPCTFQSSKNNRAHMFLFVFFTIYIIQKFVSFVNYSMAIKYRCSGADDGSRTRDLRHGKATL